VSLRPRDRAALGIVLLLALVGAFYLLALKPEQQKVSALDGQIATQRQTLTAAQQSYSAGRAAQATLKQEAAEWSALRLAVPDQSDIPALLRTLQKTAASAHVNMQSISLSGGSSAPTPAPATSSSPTTAGTSGTATGASSAPTGVPIELTFSGGYKALNSLVRRLDQLVLVSKDKVTATGPLLTISSVGLTGAPKLTVQINASIYQLSAASTAPSATPGG
jgi:hypothetical protein